MRFCHKVWLGAGGSYWHLTQGQRVWTTFPRSFQGFPTWPSLARSNVRLNTAKYRIWGKYLGAPTIVNRTPQSKVMAKSHFWPISPLYLQWKTSNWQHEPIYGTIMLNIVLWASDITSHQVKKRWKSHTIKFCPYLLHIFARSWYFSWFLPTPQCHACVPFRIGLPRRGSLSQSRWSCCQSQSTAALPLSPPSWAPAALLQFQRSRTTRLVMSAKLDNPTASLPNSTTQFNMFNLSANLSLLSVTSVDSFLRSLTQMESGALVVVVDMSLAVLRLLVDLIHPK